MTIQNASGSQLQFPQLVSGACVLYRVRGYANISPAGIVWLFDSAGEPIQGEGLAVKVPSNGGQFDIDFGANGRPFANGVWLLATNTDALPTSIGDGPTGWFDAQFSQ